MALRLKVAIRGSLRDHMRKEVEAAEKAVTAGVREATDGLKGELRQQTIAGGLGRRVGNAWRGNVYPPGKNSIEAAGFVFSKAPKIHDAFDRGALIKVKGKKFLAVPSDAVPKTGIGGKRITPQNWPEYTFGPLRYVPRKGGTPLLVIDNVRLGSKGRIRAMGVRRRKDGSEYSSLTGRATVVAFFLVPQAKLRKRIDIGSAAKKWQGKLSSLIVKNWKETG